MRRDGMSASGRPKGPRLFVPPLPPEVARALEALAPRGPLAVELPGSVRNHFVLPSSSRPRAQTEMDLMHSYLTAEELIGRPVTDDEAAELMRRLPTDWVMTVVSRIQWVIERGEVLNLGLQERLAKEIAPESMWRALRDHLRKGRVLFHEEQLLATMRLAVEFGSETARQDWVENDYREPFFGVLLAVGDLLGADIDRGKGDRDDAVRSVLRVASFSHHDVWRNAIARAESLWFTVPALVHEGERYDVQKEFRCMTGGVSLEEYLAASFSVLAKTLTIAQEAIDGEEGRWNEWAIDTGPSGYFRNTPNPDLLARGMRALSGDRETYQAALRRRAAVPRYLGISLSAFRQRPVYRMRDGLCIPLSGRFLVEGAIQNVFWLLADHLRDAHSSRERDAFTIFVGHALERHVLELCRSAYDIQGVKRVYSDSELEHRPKDLGAPDAAIFLADRTFFIEVTKEELPIDRILAPADLDAFDEWVRTRLVPKIIQLRNVIRAYREGSIRYPDGHSGPGRYDRRIWPLIVLPRPLPSFSFLARRMEQAMRAAHNDFDIQPFVIGVDELESILRVNADDWLSIVLQSHRSNVELRHVPIGMYAALVGLRAPEPVPYLDAAFDRLWDRVLSVLGVDARDGSSRGAGKIA